MLLLLITLLAQTPHHRLVLQPNLPRGAAGAGPLFQFAPPSGAGMTAPCACTSPAGAKGEALTFSRASSGTCLKGNTTSSIANGDMVTCTTDQPRVMYGGNGTGSLGLLVETTRTNSALRSQEFDNPAVWSPANSVVAAPAVTADTVVAPDGTTTADRLVVPASTGSNYSVLVQTGACAATSSAPSVFLKGHGGTSGTLDMILQGGGNYVTVCTFVGSSWTRCAPSGGSGKASTYMILGSGAAYAGGALGAAADVDIWGAQCEAGTYATSYIATTSATVARAGELADVALTFGSGSTGFSMAGTVVFDGLAGQPAPVGCVGSGAPGTGAGPATYACPLATPSYSAQVTASSPTSVYLTGGVATAATRRFSIFWGAGILNGCLDGVCGAGNSGNSWTPPTWLRWRVGTYAIATNVSDGVVKELCFDGDSSRCR